MRRGVDRQVAGGFITPRTLAAALAMTRPAPNRLFLGLQLGLGGLLLQPFAWLQSVFWGRALKRLELPDDPVIVIGHWRSGTTYLHQLMAADSGAATARNALTVAPQVSLLLKPWIITVLNRLMTATRPIDAVPWSALDPQEDEIGLARLTLDTNMAGVAFPQDYLRHFHRCVLSTTRDFQRQLLHFVRLTWAHDGEGKRHLLIKNPTHTARVTLLLDLFPKARFVLMKREPVDAVRSLTLVKQKLADLIGLQPAPDQQRQVEETAMAHRLLLEAFEAARPQIPAGQLVEVNYDELVDSPMNTVERIYRELSIEGWDQACDAVQARVERAQTYNPSQVLLEPKAEKRLQELMAPTNALTTD
ncbi:hypothetical protein MITS9509_01494 [Synechococcus sp. MIT S9509]|uniref:sulfotransferase family protein n=1 Tax=unclassified Synechococcus TaxID=2626047 RepID=UPI0007BB0A92|nr:MULTISPECIES: sulfotransferase [unclassified Synechococcus]KZR86556.1 hypothetical protein MITS9504_01157 [Synechococcus sp. MIT S9504]KZR92503.1 hypothetical protein MITS9509_01494 [Synechococcus sp. MIT S9509]